MNTKIVAGLSLVLILMLTPMVSAQSLTAGDVDDNLNFDLFLDYLDDSYETHGQSFPSLELDDRVTIIIRDSNEKGVSNAEVKITDVTSEKVLIDSYAGTDGVFRFFPTYDGAKGNTEFKIEVTPPKGDTTKTYDLDLDDLDDDRIVHINFDSAVAEPPEKLDLVFVIDATGSMSDELRYITNEFSNIISSLTDSYGDVDMRYGLVMYRDKGDAYVVRDYDFTSSLQTMQSQLNEQSANGGGDYPEAMDQGLEAGVDLEWRTGNVVRMMFLVADAPPHSGNYGKTIDIAGEAREAGIHIYPLAASGVADEAEFIMRVAGILTHGRYIWLTDDSGIGDSHAEPHIKGYVVTTLDSLIERVVASELEGKRVEPKQEDILRTVGTVKDGVIQTSIPTRSDNSTNGTTGGGEGGSDTDGGGAGGGDGGSPGMGAVDGGDYMPTDGGRTEGAGGSGGGGDGEEISASDSALPGFGIISVLGAIGVGSLIAIAYRRRRKKDA